jgi:hypothetical protein
MAFVRIQWSERNYKALHSYNKLSRKTVIIRALWEKFPHLWYLHFVIVVPTGS